MKTREISQVRIIITFKISRTDMNELLMIWRSPAKKGEKPIFVWVILAQNEKICANKNFHDEQRKKNQVLDSAAQRLFKHSE